jgi:hypothetical protein
MGLITNAADRLLSAIVPRATAAGWTCPSGCARHTCFCECADSSPTGYYHDWCLKSDGEICINCTVTVWECSCVGQ